MCFLTVAPKVVPFSFGEESFHSGQPATLQCTVSEGDQPLSIIWLKGDEKLVTGMYNISITKINRHLSVLNIEEVSAEHIGNYTCSAKNSVGTNNHTAALFVNGSCLCQKNLKYLFVWLAINCLDSLNFKFFFCCFFFIHFCRVIISHTRNMSILFLDSIYSWFGIIWGFKKFKLLHGTWFVSSAYLIWSRKLFH